jgi:hypothetical protein
MPLHTYEGVVEEGRYRLSTDDKMELEPVGTAFKWGCKPCQSTYATAIRLLTREVNLSMLTRLASRFEEEVVVKLPTGKPWRMTSDDIRRWMDEPRKEAAQCES